MVSKAFSAPRSDYTQLNLQTWRKDRGLPLETIADSTKISMRFLHAIEDEEFHKLPGGIFDRSYLRQYAAAVGFDEEKLLAFYTRKVEPDRDQEVRVTPSNRGFRRWLQFAVGR